MENALYKILLADNQPLTAAGIIYFLSKRNDIEIIDQVIQRDNLIDLIRKHQPNLLVVDYNIPGYITADDLREVSKVSRQTNILIISSDNTKSSILEVLQLGVKGYLTKECSKEEVITAIQTTSKGDKFFCQKILDIILEKHFSAEPEFTSDASTLTVRETEILKHLASGRSTQQIADDLHLSSHTVHTHRKNIIRKLNVKSPTEFVIYAMDLGLIKPKLS